MDKNYVLEQYMSSGSHAGPGELFIIPPVGGRNQSGGLCKCRDSSSQCLALTEDVSQVICYCQHGGLVDVNIPCTRDIPLVILILLVIGCIVVAAILGLICMCLCKYVLSVRDGDMRAVQTLSTRGRGCVFSGENCKEPSCRQ